MIQLSNWAWLGTESLQSTVAVPRRLQRTRLRGCEHDARQQADLISPIETSTFAAVHVGQPSDKDLQRAEGAVPDRARGF